MANEICVVRATTRGTLTLAFLYPITVPVQINGANVVPTPATNGGVSVLDPILESMLTAQEKTDLDAGTLAYEMVTYRYDPGASNAQALAKAQALYANRLSQFQTWYTTTYGGRVGQRFSAV